MHAEDAHAVECVRVAAGSGRKLDAVVEQAVDIPDKIRERFAAAGFVAARKVAQQVQVFHRCFAAADGTGHGAQRGLLQHPADQLIHGRHTRAGTQRRKLPQKRVCLAALLLCLLQGGIQRGAAALGAQLCQFVGREAADRTAQHRQQGDILRRIVDNAQQVEHDLDLQGLKRAFLFLAVGRDTALYQLFDDHRRAVFGTAQHDRKIAVGWTAALVAVCHQEVGRHDGTDTPRDIRRFQLDLIHVCKGGAVDQCQLGLTAVRMRVGKADMQVFVGGVVHLRGLFGHQARKDEIHRIAYLGAASKILVENNGGRKLRRFRAVARIVLLSAHKDLRLCLTEAVNTLLDVADGKEVFFVLRHAVEDQILHVVDVLKLIHDHRVIAARDLLALRGFLVAVAVGIGKQADGEQLDVRKGQHIFLVLQFVQPLYVVPRQVKEHAHQPLQLRKFAVRLFLGAAKILFQTIDGVLHMIAVGGDRQLYRVFRVTSRRTKHLGGVALHGGDDRVPAVAEELFLQALKIHQIVLDHRRQLFAQLFVRVRQLPHGVFAEIDAVRSSRHRIIYHDFAPERGGNTALPVALQHIVEPLVRKRLGFEKAVDLEHGVAEVFVAALARKRVEQFRKTVVVRVVKILHGAVHRRRLEQLQLALIGDAVVGGHAEGVKILLDQVAAKAVDGADGRGVEQLALTQQLRIKRVVAQQIGERLRDALLHFGCRVARKGHDEQSVRIDRMVGGGYHTDHALHEHGGLSRAGCRRNQDRAALRRDRVALLFCPFTRHYRSPPFCSFSSCSNTASFLTPNTVTGSLRR